MPNSEHASILRQRAQLRAQLRHFLIQAFADQELINFCFDYFPAVYSDFGAGMQKSQRARLLLEHCAHHGRLPDLVAALKRERPSADLEQLLSERHSPDLPAAPSPPVRQPLQIFISHAHQDAVFAQGLAAELRATGFVIWITPDSIRPGEKWVEAINRGLDESGVFLLLLTPAAVSSRWVNSEADVAIELEHEGLVQFIPAQVTPCRLPALWRAYQRLFFDRDYGRALAQLVKRLQHPG